MDSSIKVNSCTTVRRSEVHSWCCAWPCLVRGVGGPNPCTSPYEARARDRAASLLDADDEQLAAAISHSPAFSPRRISSMNRCLEGGAAAAAADLIELRQELELAAVTEWLVQRRVEAMESAEARAARGFVI